LPILQAVEMVRPCGGKIKRRGYHRGYHPPRRPTARVWTGRKKGP